MKFTVANVPLNWSKLPPAALRIAAVLDKQPIGKLFKTIDLLALVNRSFYANEKYSVFLAEYWTVIRHVKYWGNKKTIKELKKVGAKL